MKKFISLLLLFLPFSLLQAQSSSNYLLENILRNRNIPILNKVLNNPEEYRYQIIYVQINRDKNNEPHFTQYNYRNLEDEYFNPASIVKLPAAALALQKLNDLKIPGVNKYTTIQFDSSYAGQTPELKDSSSKSGLPSIGHYIKRAFLISENDAYNRLYEFLGQQYFNRELHNMGYKDIRITRQFTGMTQDQNRHTNQVRFLDKTGKLLYLQPAAYNN